IHTTKIKVLGGDKGYISDDLKTILVKEGINYLYPIRKNMNPLDDLTDAERIIMKDRMEVEHSFSWMVQYRRLGFRYDRHSEMFESFVYLAMTNIAIGKIKDEFKDNNLN